MEQSEPRPAGETGSIEWLLARVNYERTTGVPYSDRQLKLDRMLQLITLLGHPDRAAPIIHVAGTKGKGSTSAMIAAVLTAAGYRTGVYSSPHLSQIEERFSIDGLPIATAELAERLDRIRPFVDEVDRRATPTGEPALTFFDIATAVALLYFAEQACQAVVLEVGLGGRLDSTNVCLPDVCVITSISYDHTKQLGNSLASIAREKAGIIKPGVPVISGVESAEAREVIVEVARQHGCRLMELGHDFHMTYHASGEEGALQPRIDYHTAEGQQLQQVALRMLGHHQGINAAIALATLEELERQGWNLSEQARRQGLARVCLPGRLELLPGSPKVILDTAHNEASAQALATALDDYFPRPRTLVVACSKDKDVVAIARQLVGSFDRIIATRYLENPRAMDECQLADIFRELTVTTPTGAGPIIESYENPRQAFAAALRETSPSGLICVTGSFFLTAELRPLVVGPPSIASR